MRVLAAIFLLLATGMPATAQGPAGFDKIYDAPTEVNMGGRPVIADIAIYAGEETDDEVEIALVTDVTKFIDQTERDLENWIAAHQDECGERWAASEPLIDFPENAIRFALSLEYEMWNCGWNGKGKPGRIVRETGAIDVTLIPEIIDGKLQADLGALTLDERTGVNKYLPLEFVARRVIELEMRRLNENPKFFRAPQPFHRQGFVYKSIDAEKTGERVVITARYVADADEVDLDMLTRALETDGVISER